MPRGGMDRGKLPAKVLYRKNVCRGCHYGCTGSIQGLLGFAAQVVVANSLATLLRLISTQA